MIAANAATLALLAATNASCGVIYTCGFDVPPYAAGTINAQQNWTTMQTTAIVAVPEMAIVTSGGPGAQAGNGFFSSTNGPNTSTSGRFAFQAADYPSTGVNGPLVQAIRTAEAGGATAIEFSAYITAPTPATSGTQGVGARHGMVLYTVDPTGAVTSSKAACGFQVRAFDRQVFVVQWLDVGQLGVTAAGNYLINFTTPLTVAEVGYTQVSCRWNRETGMPGVKVGAAEWADVVATSTVGYTAHKFDIVNTRGSTSGGATNLVSTTAYMDSLEIRAGACEPNYPIPPIIESSGELAPFSFAQPRAWTFDGIQPNSNGASVTVRARGNLGTTTRFLTLKADGAVIGTNIFGAGSGASNCGANPETATFPIDPVTFAAMSQDGSVEFAVESSINATSSGCVDATLTISVEYQRDQIDCNGDQIDDPCQLADLDCNQNGILDPCDIAGGVADVNANGLPDTCETDCDGDLLPDSYALSQGFVPDCNGNSIPDSCDVAGGSSADIDQNGVPDECKPDCNGNQIPDAYEISQGLTSDCNQNALPDTCEIASSPALDCNGDGILDSCQSIDDLDDCNLNGVLDSCEVAANPSLDCNGDGNLDSCQQLDDNLDCDLNRSIDSCEIATNQTLDCNSNGVLDSCDLSGGSADCDANGRIDACDIAAGAEDKNQNGKLDLCELRYGDFSLDGVINGADLGAMLALWGIANPPYGDISGDGIIGGADLGLLLARWGPVP